ncbi:MAG: DNA polymerase I [Synergistaceae bacterium]|nr:DNA polymerase I [Synergistaceae bacterium]
MAHRGYHALPMKLTAPDGTPTGMIVGFMNMLYRVQDDLMPDYIVTVFDAGGKTFRHKLLSNYKANRQPPEYDLRIQIPILQELLNFIGCNVLIREGVEADDVAASFARLAQSNGYEVMLLSSDKDLLQLVGTGVKMMRPIKNGISGAEIYDVNAFVKEYGFMPDSFADYLAITGDKADNVKGVAGVGDVGAKKILAVYPHLEEIFDSLDKFSKGQRKKFQDCGLEQVKWTRDNIIKLKEDIFSGDTDLLTQCVNHKLDFDQAENLALRLGLTRVLNRIGSTKTPPIRIDYNEENESNVKFVMPSAEILTLDYKADFKTHPELFNDSQNIWDLKTAYYLLHPDECAKRFPEIISLVKESDNPAKTLYELAGNYESEIEEYQNLKHVMNDIDLPLIPVLTKMESHGVRINHEKFTSLQSELESRITEIESSITNAAGIRINLNSPQQVSWLLFERLAFTPEGMTKSGNSYSTDAGVLEKLAKLPGAEIPRLILEHRELTKMLTSFVIPFQKAADSNGIIHTTFEPALTGTGRLSSRDPNLQNIPAFGHWANEIKSGLVPVNPEKIFVSADYSQVELRILAHLSGESKLIEAFNNNRDIHTETASWVFAVMPELVTPELRRAAKMINFGLIYGMSSFGLAERLDISRQEAKEIMNKYFDAVPGVKTFIDKLIFEAKARGFTKTLAGRIRPVKEIPAKKTAIDRAIINSPIQGTAADIARKAMINCEGELFLQVHDSLVCECKESESQEVSQMLREIMKSSGGEITNLEVETKCGKTLAAV